MSQHKPTKRRMVVVREETRELILAAAEAEFASWGFASARLEDIAERVGITRAAVLYHFSGKQTLYDAVLANAFGDLTREIENRFDDALAYTDQIEGMVEAWIEFSARRPTLARLFMREVADAEDGFRAEVEALVTPLFKRIIERIESGRSRGAIRPLDPIHFVTLLAGATTWYATSSSLLRTQGGDAVCDEERFAAYRGELMRVTRFLLEANPEPGRAED
jgi:TetR/AcrR family transcriptional regulator